MSAVAAIAVPKSVSPTVQRFKDAQRRHPTAIAGAVVLLLMVLVAVFAAFLGTVDPQALSPIRRLRPVGAEHWFGTDMLGRDVYSRVIYGTRVSLAVGLAVALLATSIGLVVGLVTGYLRWLDAVMMRVMDGLMSKWTTPRAPEIKPEDFKVLELPRVTVRYARFDRKYAEALGKILAEALKVYESLGFKMPAKVTLEAQIDPSRTQLWTDGELQMFLHLKSKEILAPATRTGVYNVYGMCHELGHIAMYRNMKNLMGLPAGVGEGWAHYAGSVVVTEVAAKLGKSIWPEYYDVTEVEGMGRLKRESQTVKPWDELDGTS